ncbi:MAG: PD-(D/E)XK nuclease family protein [Clostridia bacterium]|nr:PD-(D/E)XK nuclease family protein [Clostridia bacterium]
MRPVHILGGRGGQVLPHLLQSIGQRHAQRQRIVLLVPEQYTLQAERELIHGLDLPGLIDLDVLSPRRLSRRVAERGGRGKLAPLDDRGRSMALSQALNLCRDELVYYRRVAQSPGLPDKLSSLIADMQRCGMTPEALLEHVNTLPQSATRAKEADLARIWAEYDRILEGRFADETMQQQELLRRLAPSGVLTDVCLYVYGFDVLPQPMCALLALAATLAREVTVTLTMDAKEAYDGRIFLTQRRSAAELIRHLKEKDIPWEMRYLPHRDIPGKDAALAHLEQTLFTRQEKPFAGDGSAIRIHASAHPFAEAAHAAQVLRAWHDGGIPWSRMAVALASPAGLDGILAVTLQAAGIPHYLARKDSALRHGLCRLLLASLRCVGGGYAQQDVLDAAKSGFSPLTDEESLLLENYALENGITRGKWQRPFTRGDQAESMEPLRQRLMEPLNILHDELKSARTATASVEAVFHLLENVGAYDRLLLREEELLRRGMQAEAAQNRQVWQIVMDLLDQLHALLGESRAAMKDMARFIESGLTSAAISSLPPQPDTVMVGEAGHLMTGSIDALLVMGLQDGVLNAGMDSLITESERAALADAMHRPIGLTRQEQSALRQADFYRTMALPLKHLTLTFSQGGQDGAALRPAGLIADVQALFPDVRITGGVTADGSDEAPLSPLLALDGLALRLRALADGQDTDMDARWQEALRWLWQNEAWHGRIQQVVDSLNTRMNPGTLTPEQTRRLFTQDTVSISRLEEFAACPYRHFVDYGLKPVQRRPFVFEADERGSFFHAALQGYATLASALPNWPQVEDDEIDQMLDRVLSPLTAEWEGGPLREDAMGRQLGESYVRAVRRAAWLFTRHLQNSRFTTWGAEVSFGTEGGLPPVVLTLHDGRRIALRGTIDRIDRYEGDKGLYLRVIDYKSSQKGLDPVRMWYGLQLQLLLYLRAATQIRQGALPAGAFYFTVKDPMVSADEDVKATAEKLIARSLHLKGVVLADAEVVDAMDMDEKQYSIDKVFNQDGTVAKSANALELEEMNALLDHAQRTAAQLADRIREGRMEVSPAQVEQWSACDYCEYSAICGLDPKLPGCEKRKLESMSRGELMEKIQTEC